MDEDFEDLLRDTGDPDAEFSSPEKPGTKLPILNIDERAIPSANELKLGKRVLELEKERDDLNAQIASLKSLQTNTHHPTIPILSSSTQNTPTNQHVEIPSSLIPVLAILRKHIEELTRDNQALRYAFIGPNPPSKGTIKTTQNPTISSPLPIPVTGVSVPMSAASSSKLILDIDMATIPSPSPAGGASTTSNQASPLTGTSGSEMVDRRTSQIDLEKVLERVKDLIKENEELGEMILESGRSVDLEKKFEQALEDSRKVISSLDSDLTQHLSVVQTLRTELSSYKTYFGPMPSIASSSSTSSTISTLNVPHKHPASPSNASTPPQHHSRPRQDNHSRDHRDGSGGRGDRDRDRPRNDRDRDRDRERNRDNGRRYDNGSGGRHSGGERGESRRDDKDKHGDGGTVEVQVGNGGLSIRGSASGNHKNGTGNGNGDSTKSDDRAYKRRR